MFNAHTSESRLVPATGAFTSLCVESTFHTHFSEKTQSLLVPIFGPTDCESSRILALGAGLRWPKGQQEWLSTWGFFLRESTTFRAPKVLDAFQNIRRTKQEKSSLLEERACATGRSDKSRAKPDEKNARDRDASATFKTNNKKEITDLTHISEIKNSWSCLPIFALREFYFSILVPNFKAQC